MAREKFIYNTQTLRYEKVVEPVSGKIARIFSILLIIAISTVILTYFSHQYYPSQKEEQLMREISHMNARFASVNADLEQMSSVLENIQDRDAYAHRMIIGMSPSDPGVWEGGVGGHDKYAQFATYENSGELLENTFNKVDKLKRKLILQSKSLDTIMMEAANKEEMLSAIPSIKPVRADKLKRRMNLLSGFGRRMHPVHKVVKMHYGIDFTAPKGTPIQATGNGIVVETLKKRTGYGWSIKIDHGYGIQSFYAHLSRIDVKRGQKVKKGEKIGLVGNTGTSTGSHCHYEVIKDGKRVNPIDYCQDGLSAKEYEDLVRQASAQNQSFD
ncbi:MAG: M23 family metallopeptidase [Bacteroidota bacterium]